MTAVTLKNQTVNAEFFNQVDFSSVTHLTLSCCVIDTSKLWPTLPALKKLTVEFCREHQVFTLANQPNLQTLSFYKTDVKTVDLSNSCLNVEEVTFKQTRFLNEFKGYSDTQLKRLRFLRCKRMPFPFTTPYLAIESFGWINQDTEYLPTEMFPMVKWLDISGTRLHQTPNFKSLENLRSIRAIDTRLLDDKELKIPSHVPNVVANSSMPIDFNHGTTRIVVPAQYRGGENVNLTHPRKTSNTRGKIVGDYSYQKKPVNKVHSAVKTPPQESRKVETATSTLQETFFNDGKPEPLFPERFENSHIHQAYVEKITNEAFTQFTKDELAHFLVTAPNHALVQLGMVNKYKLTKKVMSIFNKVVKAKPEMAGVKPLEFNL